MWLELLRDAVAKSSKQAVAAKLGVSRTAVSLVCSDQYPAKTDAIEKRVIEVYGRIECPFLASEISLNECRTYNEAEVPTSSPRAMRHWRACQSCPNKSGGKHEKV